MTFIHISQLSVYWISSKKRYLVPSTGYSDSYVESTPSTGTCLMTGLSKDA